MSKDNLKFRIAARCEAAGRPNNEDNYQVASNISDNQWGFTADAEVVLGDKGALLVVCDGMGGMNAGEVASDIAVRTIKECFASEKLTTEVLSNPLNYVKSAIIAADAAIKKHSKEHQETEGMGSTIVMAWMLDKKVYVGWCGDSRCYRYNPKEGLVRLSHDHSYVQELVDAGKLTEELAFDHPNNNIITRSLGDPSGVARPDVKEFNLHNEDVILLCSDGLCGCLRDNEIEGQIVGHQASMLECRDALWAADETAGWHDNVTIVLAQVMKGGVAFPVEEPPSGKGGDPYIVILLKAKNKKLKIIIALLLVFIAVIIGVGGWVLRKPIMNAWGESVTPQDTIQTNVDSVQENQNTSDKNFPKKKQRSSDVVSESAEEGKGKTFVNERNGNQSVELQKEGEHVDAKVSGVETAKEYSQTTSIEEEQTEEKK